MTLPVGRRFPPGAIIWPTGRAKIPPYFRAIASSSAMAIWL